MSWTIDVKNLVEPYMLELGIRKESFGWRDLTFSG